MRDGDFGLLPVGENDRLVGMVTDRDIVLRGVAEGGDISRIPARQVMSPEVLYCFEDQPVADVLKNMGDNQVRRMPVMNREKRLVGILSLGDLANQSANGHAGAALAEISRPGGQHSQTRM